MGHSMIFIVQLWRSPVERVCVTFQGLAGAIANPVISTSVAGLATSACQHSTLEVRMRKAFVAVAVAWTCRKPLELVPSTRLCFCSVVSGQWSMTNIVHCL